MIELVEKHAVQQSPSRVEELAKIFIHATKVWRPSCRAACWTATNVLADGDRLLGNGAGIMKPLVAKL